MNQTDANTPVVETSSTTPEVAIPAAGHERIEWQKTGNLPKAASTPATDAAKPEGEAAKSAPASEAGKPQEKKSPAAERLEELLTDLKTAGLTPAELKTFKREAAKSTQAESSPAKQPEVKAAPALEAPKEPSIDDPQYAGEDGWKKYEADVRKYNRELASYEAKKAVEDYKREQLQQQQAEKVAKEFTAAEQKYEGYKEKTQPLIDALIADMQAPAEQKTIHPVILEAIGSNPLCADILYVLGPQKDEFLALAKSNPVAALEKVAVVKHLISEELAKNSTSDTARNEKGQFQAAPEKKAKAVSDAPPPPAEVGGKGTPPADEVEAALEREDTRAYIDAQNARDLARRKR